MDDMPRARRPIAVEPTHNGARLRPDAERQETRKPSGSPWPDEGLGGLFRRHAVWLRNWLRRRVGEDRAEDLVQDTFLKAGRYAGPGVVVTHPRALLAKIARHEIIASVRRGAARAALVSELLDADAPVPPEQLASVAFRQAILEMPKPWRDVFVLNRFAGLTYVEISSRLGLSVKTVEWRMSRALAYCAEVLRT